MKRFIVCAVAVVAAMCSQAHGESNYFIGPDQGSWHDPEHWSRGYLPGTGDVARIFSDLTVKMGDDVSVQEVFVGYNNNGHMVQNAGHLAANYLAVGMSNADAYTGTYTLHGGSINVQRLVVGWDAGDNTFTMHDGDVVVRGDFWIGRHYDQRGGTVTSNAPVKIGHRGPNAVYTLTGGELTVARAAPYFEFGSGNDIYFDFRGGALNLPDLWDFDRLTTIGSSDFRVFGSPATEENLEFGWVVIEGELYTQISAIPEGDANCDGIVDEGDASILAAKDQRIN